MVKVSDCYFRHPDVVKTQSTITMRVNNDAYSPITTENDFTYGSYTLNTFSQSYTFYSSTFRKFIRHNSNLSYEHGSHKSKKDINGYVDSSNSYGDDPTAGEIALVLLQNGHNTAFSEKGISGSSATPSDGSADLNTGTTVTFDYIALPDYLSTIVTAKKVAD